MTGDCKHLAAWMVALASLQGIARADDGVKEKSGATLVAEIVDPDGETKVKKLNHLNGQIRADLGSIVRLAVDPDGCPGCRAQVVKVQQDGVEKESWKGKDLPVAFTGDHLPPASAATVVVTIKFERAAEPPSVSDYVIRYDLSQGWWAVADTVAYAVTRQQGNTAIAGAGVFVDLPPWGFLRKTKGLLRLSVVVHLLPPAAKDEPADVGVAPIGLGLFGNRVVAGVGWNISRQGLRPSENNRYVYIGFSASQLLNPKP